METPLKFEIHDPVENQTPCDFCNSKEGVLTFYVGQWDNQEVVGNACVKCIYKVIYDSLSETNMGEDNE
jgi:hypothetical protein